MYKSSEVEGADKRNDIPNLVYLQMDHPIQYVQHALHLWGAQFAFLFPSYYLQKLTEEEWKEISKSCVEPYIFFHFPGNQTNRYLEDDKINAYHIFERCISILLISPSSSSLWQKDLAS